jgi:beta-glucosidase
VKHLRCLWTFLLVAFVANVSVAQNTATNPVPRDARWVQRHEGFVEIAKKGGVDLLFIGDSITDFWRNRGSNVWAKYYAPRNAANFGISGDRTQHVLWRLENGELEGIKPKVVVLMIGTNNTGKERNGEQIRNTPPEVVEGVTAVVRKLRDALSETRILLLAIFPRADGGAEQQAQVDAINKEIIKLGEDRMVTFLDIGRHFVESDGALSREAMPDRLHPGEKGYEIWAKAMETTLVEMLNDAMR